MKFEKINDNKLKITLTEEDIFNEHLLLDDFHFNSNLSDSLLTIILDKAKKAFNNCDNKLKIDDISYINNEIIFIVSKQSTKNVKKPTKRKQVKAYRKDEPVPSTISYCFNTFDDFCNYTNYLIKLLNGKIKQVVKTSILYSYNGKYYLLVQDINESSPCLKTFFSSITEFAQVNISEIFIAKITENGKIIFSKNAFQNCLKYFND